MNAMKYRTTLVRVDIPEELLPDVLQVVVEGYLQLAKDAEKTQTRLDDALFKNSELSNRVKALEEHPTDRIDPNW